MGAAGALEGHVVPLPGPVRLASLAVCDVSSIIILNRFIDVIMSGHGYGCSTWVVVGRLREGTFWRVLRGCCDVSFLSASLPRQTIRHVR